MQKDAKIPPPGGGENLEVPKILNVSEIVLQKSEIEKTNHNFLLLVG